MVIIIYFSLMFLLWFFGLKHRTGFCFKHAVYTTFITPIIVLISKKILKKEISSQGRELMCLYNKRSSDSLFLIHWSMKIASFLLFLFFPIVYLTLNKSEMWAIVISFMIPVTGYFIPDLDLKSKCNQKKESVMQEYPVFCTDLAVMTGAGLEIVNAWKKAAEKNSKSTFYAEVNRVILKTATGMIFQDALKEFSSNLSIPEIHTFVTIINQEIKSGSGGMSLKLRDCARRSWKIREDTAKRKSEEAVSKMILPLAIGLIGILVILAAPAIMIMKGV